MPSMSWRRFKVLLRGLTTDSAFADALRRHRDRPIDDPELAERAAMRALGV